MNIAIINNLYEPLARGGAERIAKLQFEALSNSGHKVITVSLKPYGSFINNLDGHYYLNSVFPSLNKIPKLLRLFWHVWDVFNFINYFKIKKILEREKIDIVITHNMTGIGKLSLLNISKKYKHIHVLHDIALLHPSGLMFYGSEGILDSFFAKLFQAMSIVITKNISSLISPSNWLLDLHLQRDLFENANTYFLPNPLKEESNMPSVKKTENFTFLYVGLISDAKGVSLLLATFSRINRDNKKIKLILIGKLIDSYLQGVINKNTSVEYLGELKHDDIMNNMRTADCLIVPSICYENSPTVIYEAISQGTFVISSDIGGATELIKKFGGLLFEPGDRRALQAQMERTIKTPIKMEDKIKLSESITELYNLESYSSSLENIINYQESH